MCSVNIVSSLIYPFSHLSIQGKWFTIDCNLYSKPNLIINEKKKRTFPFVSVSEDED